MIAKENIRDDDVHTPSTMTKTKKNVSFTHTCIVCKQYQNFQTAHRNFITFKILANGSSVHGGSDDDKKKTIKCHRVAVHTFFKSR